MFGVVIGFRFFKIRFYSSLLKETEPEFAELQSLGELHQFLF